MAKKEEYKLKRNYEQFGIFLQQARIKADLTQREVSIELGYSSAQFISNFERGISTPPWKKLKELIRIYKLKVDKVIELLMKERAMELRNELRS